MEYLGIPRMKVGTPNTERQKLLYSERGSVSRRAAYDVVGTLECLRCIVPTLVGKELDRKTRDNSIKTVECCNPRPTQPAKNQPKKWRRNPFSHHFFFFSSLIFFRGLVGLQGQYA